MYVINEDESTITINNNVFSIYSKESFEIIKKLWIKLGWANKYSYQFTWLGRPIIQLPEDILKAQEIIFNIKPTLIIETGVAHGGSLIFYASLLKLLGGKKVIGVDIEIRNHNKQAILSHPLAGYVQLVEGSSIEVKTVNKVNSFINAKDRVLIFLDSNHTRNHVLKELECYSNLVTVGSYIVVNDGVMKDLHGVPRAGDDWSWNNPQSAIQDFLQNNSNFVLEDIDSNRFFNESLVGSVATYWPNAWLKRIK